MKLQYAGLKPVICEHGVSFKNGKEDKFVYLPFTVDILKAIDHSYEQKKVYSHQLDSKTLSPNEILDIIIKFHPDLEKTMNNEIDSYKIHLDKEEAEVANRQTLSDIEKETYIANLKLMREYKIQRAKNKIFYFHYIETIVETIIKHKIKEIDTPFNEKFWHILQSIEGKLSSHKISSTLKVKEENNRLKAILSINII
jgi:DNA-binding XRE family transcriptional regulator